MVILLTKIQWWKYNHYAYLENVEGTVEKIHLEN